MWMSLILIGGIEHIGTKQLQRSFLKACLCLGIHIHYGVEFEGVEEVEPGRWKVKQKATGGDEMPDNKRYSSPGAPLLSEFKFGMIVGADGEHSKVFLLISKFRANEFRFQNSFLSHRKRREGACAWELLKTTTICTQEKSLHDRSLV